MERFRLMRNIVTCNKCGDTIESKYISDCVRCKCGAIGTNGGTEYQRLVGEKGDICLKKSIYKDAKRGTLITHKELGKLKKNTKELMDSFGVMSVGNGFIDCICSKDEIIRFSDALSKIDIEVTHFTLWEVVEKLDDKPKAGMGGPKNRFAEGWYAELNCNNFEYRGIENLLEIVNQYELEFGCVVAPGLWLDI
ncbi:hypothetical protein G7062_04175 [Erysipelothrix sp. HDW6C]|uniref:DUF7695 domain-containing protein n=1 Tax=Erysipelothrix sp. HDW6C TaxID=2714930 RepID=UPI00140CFC3A|nr:hypothetical protein [Erysipelothrix sp. HDW6C]QIK68757.1 hypothetical protein G7062_04175 [Erysipelothrix sp. HDW6C]